MLHNNPCIVLPVLHKNLREGFTMTSDTCKKYVDFRLPSIFHRGLSVCRAVNDRGYHVNTAEKLCRKQDVMRLVFGFLYSGGGDALW